MVGYTSTRNSQTGTRGSPHARRVAGHPLCHPHLGQGADVYRHLGRHDRAWRRGDDRGVQHGRGRAPAAPSVRGGLAARPHPAAVEHVPRRAASRISRSRTTRRRSPRLRASPSITRCRFSCTGAASRSACRSASSATASSICSESNRCSGARSRRARMRSERRPSCS